MGQGNKGYSYCGIKGENMEKTDIEKLNRKKKQHTDYVAKDLGERGEATVNQINKSIERAYHLGRATAFAMFFEFAEQDYDLDAIMIGMNKLLKENPDFAKDVYAIRKEIEGRF